MNKTTVTKVPGASIIQIERIFDAPRESVFAVFTQNELLQKWWSPTGDAHAKVDARPGGAWELKEESNGVSFFGFFHDVTAPERIVQTGEFSMSSGRGHVVLERYEFTQLKDGKTKMQLTEAFLSVHDRDVAIKSGMEFGLAMSYEKIDALLQGGYAFDK